MKRTFLTLAVIAGALISSCSSDDDSSGDNGGGSGSDNIEQAIVGQWQLISETELGEDITDQCSEQTRLVINADGTFSATSAEPIGNELANGEFEVTGCEEPETETGNYAFAEIPEVPEGQIPDVEVDGIDFGGLFEDLSEALSDLPVVTFVVPGDGDGAVDEVQALLVQIVDGNLVLTQQFQDGNTAVETYRRL